MSEFSSYSALAAEVQKTCKEILKKDVAPVVKKILTEHIQHDIYDAYTPKPNGWVSTGSTKGGSAITFRDTYHRRGSLLKNVESFVRNDDGFSSVLSVTSTAKPMPSIRNQTFHSTYHGFFLEMLEALGTEKARGSSLWFGEFPRPAVTLAQKEINDSPEIINAIQTGMDREFG